MARSSRSRWRHPIAAALCGVLVSSGIARATEPEADKEENGASTYSVPVELLEHTLTDAEGEAFDLAGYDGSLVAVVFRSIGRFSLEPWVNNLDVLAPDYQERGLEFVGCDLSGLPARHARRLLEVHGAPPYPMALETGRRLAGRLAVPEGPGLAVVDLRDGTEAARLVLRYAPGRAAVLRGEDPTPRVVEALDRLLAGEPLPPAFRPPKSHREFLREHYGPRGWDDLDIPVPERWRLRGVPRPEISPHPGQGELRHPIYWGRPVGR